MMYIKGWSMNSNINGVVQMTTVQADTKDEAIDMLAKVLCMGVDGYKVRETLTIQCDGEVEPFLLCSG